MPTNRLTVEQLVSHFNKILPLRQPDNRYYQAGECIRLDTRAGDSLTGFYHPWHPISFPVIGPREITRIGPESLDTLSQTACLILSDGLEPPEFLHRAKIPLLLTDAAASRVVALLMDMLPALIFQKHVVHGVFMAIHYQGILITGAPGSGKSELALSLLQRGHRLVADDAPEFLAQPSGEVIGFCPDNLFGFLHSRNLGIIDIRDSFAVTACLRQFKLDGIVSLTRENNNSAGHLLAPQRQRLILDAVYPEQLIAANTATDNATLVELFAKQLAMIAQGRMPAPDSFNRRLGQEPVTPAEA